MSFEEDYAPYNDGDSYDEMDVRFGWDLRNHEVYCLTMALRKAETERDALKAYIDGGIRVHARANKDKQVSYISNYAAPYLKPAILIFDDDLCA